MKRTGTAIIIVRPKGKNAPPYWPRASATDEPAWMTLDVENAGEIYGRTLGIALEFAFPARFVNAAMRSFRSEEGDRCSWEVKVLSIEDRPITKRKRRNAS